MRVDDTQYGLPGLVLHRGEVVEGTIAEGDEAVARIDGARRDAIRRNHTATHVLHWALREVLGPHVKQAGSFVGPDRLRFDFSHHEALTRDQLDRIEALANAEIIGDAPVRHYETTKEHAESLGAIAFFGDKYGDLVRVLEAGEHSIELCGGTHVHALGFIGPIKIVSEGSIGANLRRIEAVTGEGALERIHDEEVALRGLADTLKVSVGELPARVDGLLARVKELEDEVAKARTREATAEAGTLAATAVDGAVVAPARRAHAGRSAHARHRDARRARLRVSSRSSGVHDGKAGLAVAVSKDRVEGGVSAAELARDAAKALGGGTAKHADVVQGGGQNVDAVDDALALLARRGAARRGDVAPGADGSSASTSASAGSVSRSPTRRGVLASPHATLERAADAGRRPPRHRRRRHRGRRDRDRGRPAPVAVGRSRARGALGARRGGGHHRGRRARPASRSTPTMSASPR